MIEKELEKIVIDRVKETLENNGITDFQMIGVWQDEDCIKGEENESPIIVAVKATPRTYETPTIPDAQIQIELSLAVRSDVDYSGKTYIDVSSLISDLFQNWQNNYSKGNEDFTIQDTFFYTGFNLDGGDCGIDRDNCIWQYSQTFTIYGVIRR